MKGLGFRIKGFRVQDSGVFRLVTIPSSGVMLLKPYINVLGPIARVGLPH